MLVSAIRLTAQDGSAMIRYHLIVYPWLPPTQLLAADVSLDSSPDAYEPKELELFYYSNGIPNKILLQENQIGEWFQCETTGVFELFDTLPVADTPREPVARITLPKTEDAIFVLLLVPSEDGRYRLMPIPMNRTDFSDGQVKIANLGRNPVIGMFGDTRVDLKGGGSTTYTFNDSEMGKRVAFAYQDEARWRPFYNSYVVRPRSAVSLLFVHPFESQQADARYTMRRIAVPVPSDD